MTRRKSNDEAPHQRTAASAPALYVWFDHRPWLLALVLLVATFAAYQSTWRAGFIWDDDDHLTANSAVAASNGLRLALWRWSSSCSRRPNSRMATAAETGGVAMSVRESCLEDMRSVGQ